MKKVEKYDTPKIETRGIEFIPENERNSNPLNVFFVFVGAQFCYAIMVLGTLPIIFGLGWWDAFWAITLGLILGCLIIAPIGLIGQKNGTNGIVSSRAKFGIRGGVIGGIITLFICFGFGALNIWTGAQAVIFGGERLFNWSVSDNKMALASILLMLSITVIAFFGYKLVVFIEKFGTWLIGLLLMLAVLVCLPHFDPTYTGGEYILSGYWPTWLLSFFIAAGLPISYGPLVNDYTRYIPSHTSHKKTILGLSTGMFIGCWLSMIIAAYLMTMFVDLSIPFVEGLYMLVPGYFILPIFIIGLLGSIPQGSVAYYSASLTLSSLGWNIGRLATTIISSIIMIILVLIGIYLYDMVSLVDGFISIIIVAASPWLIINMIGYSKLKGTYSPLELHISHKGSLYWFRGGYSIPATISWLIGFVVGLLFTSSILFEGPLVKLINGVDISLFAAALAGGIMYLALDAFQPKGAESLIEKRESV